MSKTKNINKLTFSDINSKYILPHEHDLYQNLIKELNELKSKVVVLDDDPTGTQTVHSVPILTEWSVESLSHELTGPSIVFYILTNSRSLSETEAKKLYRLIGNNLRKAFHMTGQRFVVISRSDSTLRGHFPSEVYALIDGFDFKPDGILLIPCFFEGGRYTVDDIQYVTVGNELIPVSETDFARDPVFGFNSSNLKSWVEEKTNKQISAKNIQSISLQEIRQNGAEYISEKLLKLCNQQICIVNALTRLDLKIFTLGVLKAERNGQKFLYRTASSFIPIRGGILPRSLLSLEDFDYELKSFRNKVGGLIIVGSFVSLTTSQIHHLIGNTSIHSIEVDVHALLENTKRNNEIKRVANEINKFISVGEDVIVYTSRELVTQALGEHLLTGKIISDGLVKIIQSIKVRPKYFLVKGGITSSEIATKALGVRRAIVKGQILAGVPVWSLGEECKFPSLDYIVFPGNVGSVDALTKIYQIFNDG